MAKRHKLKEPALTCRTEVLVRFSDVDAMKVAWHGSYVAYLEDGREAFGIAFPKGLGYADYFSSGYVAPVVSLNINYKQSLRCGDVAIVEVRYIPTDAAKIIFEYIIYRKADMAVMATAETIQVFTTYEGEMQYTCPEFYTEWKNKWLKK